MTTLLRLATAADDAALRALLRDNGMPGRWVEMSLQREPAFFAGDNGFGREWAVLAEDEGRLVGMYTAAVMPLWVNGREAPTGYLGGLRIQPAERRRVRHLRAGFASIRRLAPATPAGNRWFTVTTDDNGIARRLLEAGVRGLPRYRPLARYLTHALPRARARRLGHWRRVERHERADLLAWQRRIAADRQFAPALDEAMLERVGAERAWVHEDARGPAAFAAFWDQRAHRQVVARRYPRALRWAIPFYNGWARLARRVPLPRQGCGLQQCYLSFLTLAPHLEADPGRGRELIADLLAQCPAPIAALGLVADHPWTPMLSSFRGMVIPARIHAVEFDDEPAEPLDCRPVHPEAALL